MRQVNVAYCGWGEQWPLGIKPIRPLSAWFNLRLAVGTGYDGS